MSELFKIILTASLTVIGGILVFVVGQIIAKFFIEPMHEQFRLIGEIANSLIFYANVYSNPGSGKPDKMDEASKMLRQQASQLMARTHAIRWYKLWQFLRIVPKYVDVIEASRNLIGPSNSIHQGNPMVNNDMRKGIEKRLRIKTNI
jgi:hypothetical protein